jgi:hypothetical protein
LDDKVMVEKIHKKTQTSKPDFMFVINNKKYYLECTSTVINDNNSEKYPYLSASLKEGSGQSKNYNAGVEEYKSRLVSAFRTKACCKYDPTKCDPHICNHEVKSGYINHIEGHGFIIAISMARISVYNQPNNYLVDSGWFFRSFSSPIYKFCS